MKSDRAGVEFPYVFSSECRALEERWQNEYGGEHRRVFGSSAEDTPSTQHELVGLALSGGGTRSATFNLGALQALNDRGAFGHVDYLSTVSGGGYLGAGISARMRREGAGFPFSPGRGAVLVAWMRNVSSRLTPSGLRDSLTVLAAFLRGIVNNLLLFVPIVLLLAVYVYARQKWAGVGTLAGGYKPTLGVAFTALLYTLVFPLVAGLYGVLQRLSGRPRSSVAGRMERQVGASLGALLLLLGIVAVLDTIPAMLRRLHSIEAVSDRRLLLVAAIAAVLLAAGLSAARAIRARGAMQAVLFLSMSFFGLLAPIFALLYSVLVVAEGLTYEWGDRVFDLAGVAVPGWGVVLLLSFAVNGYFWLTLNPNQTSIHGLYADRLSRGYLEDPETVSEGNHDANLAELQEAGSRAPYHLINTALNIQGTRDPFLQGRGTEPFFFSRHWVGSFATGYCPTVDLEKVAPGSTRLSTAMAVSGGAVSPQMGGYTRRALVPLLAMFNVRLGYWVPNPGRLAAWIEKKREGRPLRQRARWIWRVRPSALFREMFSWLDEDQQFVNVSDGGHVENLGIYELLRRRCRYIIAGDAGADPEMTFEDLGTLIRRAKLDLGIDIQMLLDDLELQETGLSNRHCAVGRILYPSLDGGQPEYGYLLFYKLALTGDEPVEISGYHARHQAFPHESTADQSFTEDQFEAYRALGYHTIDGLFLGRSPAIDFDHFRHWFETLREQLAPTRFLESLGERVYRLEDEIERAFDTDRRLDSYRRELEEGGLFPRTDDDAMAAKSMARRQLRLMYEVFKGLRLFDARHLENPAHAGWRGKFERWARSETFQLHYGALIGSYSPAFRHFCQVFLGLPSG